jgi:hypothetical protein
VEENNLLQIAVGNIFTGLFYYGQLAKKVVISSLMNNDFCSSVRFKKIGGASIILYIYSSLMLDLEKKSYFRRLMLLLDHHKYT